MTLLSTAVSIDESQKHNRYDIEAEEEIAITVNLGADGTCFIQISDRDCDFMLTIDVYEEDMAEIKDLVTVMQLALL